MTSQAFLQIVNEIQACTCLIEQAKDQSLVARYSTQRQSLYKSLLYPTTDSPTQGRECLPERD
jgi:hypothetical protein